MILHMCSVQQLQSGTNTELITQFLEGRKMPDNKPLKATLGHAEVKKAFTIDDKKQMLVME